MVSKKAPLHKQTAFLPFLWFQVVVLALFRPTNNDSYFIVLVWQWSLCTGEEMSVGQTIVPSTFCQKGRNVLKCESWGVLFWEWAGFISGQRVGGWEVCEGLWSSLSSLLLSQQTSVVFLSCHRRCLQRRRSVQLHSVSLVYTHMLWRSPPLRSLILCKFHQWLKGFVCCVVHERVCIPASGSPNIPSHVRTTGAVRRTEGKEGGKRGK